LKPRILGIALTVAAALGVTTHAQPGEGFELQGVAKVKAAWLFHVCDISLYAPAGSRPDTILDGRSFAIEVTYARSISRDKLVEYGNKGLENAWDQETIDRFSEELEQINGVYQDVVEGDRYELECIDDQTLILRLNDNQQISISQEGFPTFYAAIWLGEHKAARKIKESFFGG
jgi:hypothetical protein